MKIRNTPSNVTTCLPQFMIAFVLVLSFALSRVIFWLMGVRYDSSPLNWYWQYLDVDVLRHRLLSGLLYLHAQPPGFNLFLGIVLKLFPDCPSLCFHIVYILLGLMLYGLLYYFLRLSQFSRPIALLCAFLFVISPGVLLYENWLFYTYPVAVLLVLATVALRRFQDTLNTFYAVAFLLAIVIVCLTRSAFHLVFLVVCVFFVLIQRGAQRRKTAFWAYAALFLVAAFYLKNLAMFGFFGASSWTGMNMFKIASHSVGTNVVAHLADSGRIYEVAKKEPFSPIHAYPGRSVVLRWNHADVPELTAEKKVSGAQNLNHEAYISIAKEYQIASLYIMRNYSRLYLSGVFDAWLIYGAPSWGDCRLKESNRSAVSGYTSPFSFLNLRMWVDLQGFRRVVFGVNKEDDLYPLIIFLVPSIIIIACAGSVVRLYKLVRHGDASGLTFTFMTMTVVYIAVIGNAFEYGENNRFRAETDPLIFLLSVIICRDTCIYMKRKFLKMKVQSGV